MNINMIARMAGVSRATVSRYLNDGYVSDEKREAIARVIKQTGYVPSRQARTLRTGKTNLVGVIIPKINSVSVSRMVAGITCVLNGSQYQMLLANTDNDESVEVEYLQLFAERNHVDGIILIGTIFTPAHERVFKKLDVPLVILGQEREGSSCVFHDDYHALREITRLALKRGRRPAFIGVNEHDVSAGKRRHQGFLDACGERGLTPPPSAQLVAGFTVDSGYFACERLLEAHPLVDTIVCSSDSIAFGSIVCLREYGRRVPEDVQVTGVGDSELSKVVTPTLTTIHHHYRTSGVEAAKMLVEAMGQGGVNRRVCMSHELLVRNSTRS
ncbi:LacI family DNA-binding transcriptional regulator [Olsenella sp. HMSC062G07]|uniref:LacI family DNA-binding transcriptional regulator n=1 Tax=Olsenella sp. HMSC062G07 TaxID=1739330 RepID=UPI0008A5979C|nr:LacI family DNA-binding transcriptional regulator [Olsenella sp. HMSC062G07]OFK22690.1 transcriptional regulator [Olsenella sp. HMSC062G07]